MSNIVGGEGGAAPQKLEGRTEGSKPREFFWDSITLYIVGIILALAVIDTITEFIRGSNVACFAPKGTEVSDSQANYINNFCSMSLPRTEYFPVFIVVHGILIAIPHYLWLNHYGGNLEFFFIQAREMDRIRSEDTGSYSEKNRIIIQQLTRAFTTYKQNWMYVLYLLKLFAQLVVTLAGLFIAVFFFRDFDETFLCPRHFDNSTASTVEEFWPLDKQVQCIFTSLRLFSAIHIADLILLSLLALCYLWSLIWCTNSHSTELGTNEVALFCFHTGMHPEHHVPNLPGLGCCCHPFKTCIHKCFKSIPWFGPGPRIHTNLDFLVLMLFRTDSGLGFVFREMQILQRIKHHNDDDQRRTNLHKRQQQTKSMRDGDLIHPSTIKGFKGELKWRLSKVAQEEGIFDASFTPLQHDQVLIIPNSLRGAILGFALLAPKNGRAIFVTFGSVSLGIPSALSRVFTKVGILNFNPHFKTNEADPFMTTTLASDIVHVTYPEDILSSEIGKSSDFGRGLTNIWSPSNATTDFIVIGPVDNGLHLSTLSLFLAKIAKTRFTKGCILLTIHPTEIASKPTGDEFHSYLPPRKFFQPYAQKVFRDTRAQDLEWPPQNRDRKEPKGTTKNSSFEFCVECGHTTATFTFSLYKYPPGGGGDLQKKEKEKTDDTKPPTGDQGDSKLAPSSGGLVPFSTTESGAGKNGETSAVKSEKEYEVYYMGEEKATSKF